MYVVTSCNAQKELHCTFDDIITTITTTIPHIPKCPWGIPAFWLGEGGARFARESLMTIVQTGFPGYQICIIRHHSFILHFSHNLSLFLSHSNERKYFANLEPFSVSQCRKGSQTTGPIQNSSLLVSCWADRC